MGRSLVLPLAALLGIACLNIVAESQFVNPNLNYYPYNSYLINGQQAYNAYGNDLYGTFPPGYKPGVSYVAGIVVAANSGVVGGMPSYVYSKNNLPLVTGKVVIVSDYDPLAAKSLELDSTAFSGNESVLELPTGGRRRRQAAEASCEFVANSRLNTLVQANTLTLNDHLVLIASPQSTPISVTRILADHATLVALGKRTNLFLATVPTQKAHSTEQRSEIDAANVAIRALASAEPDVHLIDYATKLTDAIQRGTSLTPSVMCAWVREQVANIKVAGQAVPSPPTLATLKPGLPAPSPAVTSTPIPGAPALKPVSPAPIPVAPAPIPVAPAPIPVAPAPNPVAPAPIPVAPAPNPVAPAPIPVAPAPIPVAPAPNPAVPASSGGGVTGPTAGAAPGGSGGTAPAVGGTAPAPSGRR